MNFKKEFIWNKDHYACHITSVSCMEDIIRDGLKPMNGERSQSVGDTRRAIYFFDNEFAIADWMKFLYPDEIGLNLEVLRFNLKGMEWFIQDPEVGEFYLMNNITPDRLEYLRLYNKDVGEYVSLDSDIYKCQFSWYPLSSWKPLDKNKSLIKKKMI